MNTALILVLAGLVAILISSAIPTSVALVGFGTLFVASRFIK